MTVMMAVVVMRLCTGGWNGTDKNQEREGGKNKVA